VRFTVPGETWTPDFDILYGFYLYLDANASGFWWILAQQIPSYTN